MNRTSCGVMLLACLLGLAGEGLGQCTTYWMYTYDCDVLPNASGAIEKIGGGSGSFYLSNSDPCAVYLNGDGTLTINDLVTSVTRPVRRDRRALPMVIGA